MKILFLGLTFCVSTFAAQGWTDLASTHLQTVCPPDNSGGNTYAFTSFCHYVIDAWGGAAADTKRNRLILWGGGGPDYNGNEVYAVTVAGAISRLTDPSLYATSGCPQANVSDSTPVSRHSYNGLVYLPVPDRMFAFSGRIAPCDGGTNNIWTLDLSVTPPVWHAMDPTNGTNLTLLTQSSGGANCVYNPNDQLVYCWFQGGDRLFTYNYSTNTVAVLNASVSFPDETSVVLDPIHQLMIFVGKVTGDATARIEAVDLTPGSTYAKQDWTGTFTGCDTVAALNYPALTWNSARAKIEAYPASGNTVYLFDPITRVCTAQTFTGGPTVAPSNGQFSRYAYFPSSGKSLVVTKFSADAFTFQLDPTSISGMGSSTLTCLDKDGDTYGVGPGCAGPDADDLDSGVHTGAQCVTAYSTLAGCLTHLGYTPANIFYVAPGGSDTGSPAACKNTIGSPCATASYVFAHGFAAGDMVLFRAGTWTNLTIQPTNGAAGTPSILMAYPGETALFSESDTFNRLDVIDRSYIVMDGLSATLGTDSGCIDGGTSTGSTSLFNHNIFTHLHTYACKWGLDAFDGLQYIDIAENVFRDNNGNVAEHGLYIGSRGIVSLSVSVRRNLLYGNDFNGMQFNGRVTNLAVDQNISYNNLVAGFSWEQGVHDSFLRSNLAFQNQNASLQIANYPGDCSSFGQGGSDSICPYDQINNLIENNTFWQGDHAADGSSITGSAAIAIANSAVSKVGDLGHNTFRNNLLLSYSNSNNVPEVYYQDAGTAYLSTSTFDSNIFWHSDNNAAQTGVIGNGPSNPLTCAAAAMVGTVTNCINSNPLFVAASNTYWNSVTSFNFHLLSGSPGNATGSLTGIPTADVYGVAFGSTPSMGSNATITSVGSGGTGASGNITISGKVTVQ